MIDVCNNCMRRVIYEIIKEHPGISARDIFKIYNKELGTKETIIRSKDSPALKKLYEDGYVRAEKEDFTNNLGKISVRRVYYIAKDWPEQQELNINHYSWDWVGENGEIKRRYGIVS